MTKQEGESVSAKREEILRGIALRMADAANGTSGWYRDADGMLNYLDSVGCVLKVGRELPQNPYDEYIAITEGWEYLKQAWREGQDSMADRVAVESLIEEQLQ